MTINEELKTASFRETLFFYRGGSEDGGFKVAEHTYPGSDNVIIEQLGKRPRRFSMEAQILLAGRDAFDTALNTPGIGTLVHPLYGNFQVKVSEYTKDDNINSLGLYDYSIVFTVEVGIISPTAQSVSSSDVNARRVTSFADTSTFMQKSLSVVQASLTFGLNRNIVLTGLSDQINLLLDDIVTSVRRVVNADNSDLNDVIEGITEDLISIIANNTINDAFNTLFSVLDLVGATAIDRYLIYRGLFGFGLDKTVITDNPQLENSLEITEAGARLYNLSIAYDSAVDIDFVNQEELDEIIEQLDTEFQSLVNGGVINVDSRLALIDLRTTSMKFFSTLNLRAVSEFETTLVPSTVLSFRLYGTSELSDDIVSLNKAYNTGFIKGMIKVLSAR